MGEESCKVPAIWGGRVYIEGRLRQGGLRLVSGSPTMLQDEFARLEQELRDEARIAPAKAQPQ